MLALRAAGPQASRSLHEASPLRSTRLPHSSAIQSPEPPIPAQHTPPPDCSSCSSEPLKGRLAVAHQAALSQLPQTPQLPAGHSSLEMQPRRRRSVCKHRLSEAWRHQISPNRLRGLTRGCLEVPGNLVLVEFGVKEVNLIGDTGLRAGWPLLGFRAQTCDICEPQAPCHRGEGGGGTPQQPNPRARGTGCPWAGGLWVSPPPVGPGSLWVGGLGLGPPSAL